MEEAATDPGRAPEWMSPRRSAGRFTAPLREPVAAGRELLAALREEPLKLRAGAAELRGLEETLPREGAAALREELGLL